MRSMKRILKNFTHDNNRSEHSSNRGTTRSKSHRTFSKRFCICSVVGPKRQRMTQIHYSCDYAWSLIRYTIQSYDQSAYKRKRDRKTVSQKRHTSTKNLLLNTPWNSKNDGVQIRSRLGLSVSSIMFRQRSLPRRLSSRSRDIRTDDRRTSKQFWGSSYVGWNFAKYTSTRCRYSWRYSKAIHHESSDVTARSIGGLLRFSWRLESSNDELLRIVENRSKYRYRLRIHVYTYIHLWIL